MSVKARIQPGEPNEKGWRDLIYVDGEEHLGEAFPVDAKPLLVMHHLSDLHVCDAQSPIRPEYLDRWADPDSPVRESVGTIGVYRPHSMLSPHVVEAMIQSLNAITTGPLSGAPVDGAIITGDTTDNAQVNEVSWFLTLLDGGELTPDSGSAETYEGVMGDSSETYDVKYWHPHGTPAGGKDDDARARYGFPEIKGLLDSCRAPIKATGLRFPWYAVHGNHDALLQGTVTPTQATQLAMADGKRYEDLPSNMSLMDALSAFCEVGPAQYPEVSDAPYIFVTPDADRRAMERGEYAARHLASPGLPGGHGFTQQNVDDRTMYYTQDVGGVRLVVMDTVNEHGGWQGSLDEAQFGWLEEQLSNADRPVVLASHHPLPTMFNDYAPHGAGRRICHEELESMILDYPVVIAWLAGHEHRHQVRWVGSRDQKRGFWHIETASHADWPQQSRVVEIVEALSGKIFIALTVVDHEAPLAYDNTHHPVSLAALSRVLSANVWQRRAEFGSHNPLSLGEGTPEDRNIVLKLKRH
ncbi:MAG TPA: TIGR03767 family metallophosphoesterase [Candidatus Nanopelagicaceae bacterium]|nr:TIGR03767 family metallophosphoesterase [Candidatus Nanopelagicaceae bacterium]